MPALILLVPVIAMIFDQSGAFAKKARHVSLVEPIVSMILLDQAQETITFVTDEVNQAETK